MTRHEQDYYHDVGKQTTYLRRIAEALEKIVNTEKNDKLDRFKKTANLIYSNDVTVNPEKGRSDENYTYPEFVDKYYKAPTSLEQRMYNESQNLPGGEFRDWHQNLTKEEKAAYTDVYGF